MLRARHHGVAAVCFHLNSGEWPGAPQRLAVRVVPAVPTALAPVAPGLDLTSQRPLACLRLVLAQGSITAVARIDVHGYPLAGPSPDVRSRPALPPRADLRFVSGRVLESVRCPRMLARR